MLITRAAISEGFDSTHIPSYGPESRGGTSYADVRVVGVPFAEVAKDLGSVLIKNVVALNSPAFERGANLSAELANR